MGKKQVAHIQDDKTGKVHIYKVDKKRGSLDEPTVIKDGPLRIFRKKGKGK